MNRHEHARMVQTAAEDTVIELLQDAGYDVQTNGHTIYGHVTINGTLHVEVKGATWTKHKHSRGRYQFNIRQKADVYILACMREPPRFFVVPGHIIGARANVAIWSEYPSRYIGRWSQYCDNWNVIKTALAR